jgi:LacI family transcriptional regulator
VINEMPYQKYDIRRLTFSFNVAIMLSISGTITGSITGTIPVHQRIGRVTIKEVASAADVSTQTVSRVINNRPDVSPQTRKHVQEIIDQLGYQPSDLARSLIRQRSYTLGVVTAGLKYIGPSRTLSGITHAAERAGYSLLLKELSHFNANNVDYVFQTLLSRHVDGIIWAVPEVGENRNWVTKLSMELEIPIVYLTMKSQEKIWVVSINNYLGGQLAVSHLLGQGYQHIGHISGPLDWCEARERMAAWREVLKEANLEVKDEHWAEGNWSSASGAQAIEILYKKYPEMDAIFVANDQMALSVMQYACRRGLRIPDDLGVVGFDDIPESAYFWPPLTTVQQDQHNVGEVAVEEIIKIIESYKFEQELERPKSILLAPTLIVRQSSLRKQGVEGGESGKQ